MSIYAEQRTRLLHGVLVVAGAVAVACCVLVPKASLVALVGCAALVFLAVIRGVFRGRIDALVLCWAGSFPLSYFVCFPREHPVVTLQRLVVLGAFIALFFAKPSTLMPTPKALRRVAVVCLAFIAVAAVTLGKSADVLGPARVLLDGFLLPILFGWYIIARFDVRRWLPTIHTAVCVSSIICAAVAVAEIITGQDLLPYEGSAISFAGGIARPNGPFASNDALALVGALSFFLLLFLRVALGSELSAGRKVLHSIGLVGAMGMALMPMFRSVALTLLLALIVDTFWEKRTTRRAGRVVLMAAFVGLIFVSSVFAPDMFRDRSGSENVYGRVAEYKQTLRVFVEHPLLGVGFSNFYNFVVGEPQYRMSYEGVSSLDWPHSNLAAVLGETGALGFMPYVMTQVLLLMAMWQLRRVSSSGYLVWKYFVYMFLTYWITGLTETSGYDEFLNLWYVFAVIACYKYGLTEPDLTQPAEVQLPDEALNRVARTL